MYKILFVCLGNICRSCTAQHIMQKLVDDAGLSHRFYIDSAGLINYHEGELPDARMRKHAERRGYALTHRSRPVKYDDFFHFDLILGMDERNIDTLMDRAPGTDEQKKIARMAHYCTLEGVDHVPDPYYGGEAGFELVIDILENACSQLLCKLTREELPGDDR